MPTDTSAAEVPHALLEQLLAHLRGRPEFTEPLLVDEREAGRLLSCSGKTVARIPDEVIGRVRIGDGGRAVRYLMTSLRAYAESLAKKG